jgi:hypothetical protein
MTSKPPTIELTFNGEVIYWRGPSPFHFVAVPEDECGVINDISSKVTYGWGVIPVTARIGATSYTTSLFPKDGRYLLPVKAAVRASENITVADIVTACLSIKLA